MGCLLTPENLGIVGAVSALPGQFHMFSDRNDDGLFVVDVTGGSRSVWSGNIDAPSSVPARVGRFFWFGTHDRVPVTNALLFPDDDLVYVRAAVQQYFEGVNVPLNAIRPVNLLASLSNDDVMVEVSRLVHDGNLDDVAAWCGGNSEVDDIGDGTMSGVVVMNTRTIGDGSRRSAAVGDRVTRRSPGTFFASAATDGPQPDGRGWTDPSDHS